MSKEEELAYALFNAGRLEENSGGVGTTTTMYGDAVSDSSNGYVKVTLDGDVSATYADGSVGSNVLNLPTVPNVVKGDKVIIQCVGTTAKTMTVIGVVGSGDRTQGAAGQAASDAAKAQAEAAKAQQQAEEADAKAKLEQQRTNCNNDMFQTSAKNIIDAMGNQGSLKASTGQLIFTASSAQPTASHTGDLWLDTANSKAYKWDGSAWVALDGDTAKDDTDKLIVAANVEGSPFKVFTATPTTPYKVGDLYLTDIEKGDIYRCIKAREEGDYSADDWCVTSSYDSAMSQLIRALDAGKANLETKAKELKAQADEAWAKADDLGQVATNDYKVEYIQTDSATTAPSQDATGWSKTAPTRADGKYIWMRSTYYIGTGDYAQLTHSEPSCITGDAGKDGTGKDGVSVTGSDTFYRFVEGDSPATPDTPTAKTGTPDGWYTNETDAVEPNMLTGTEDGTGWLATYLLDTSGEPYNASAAQPTSSTTGDTCTSYYIEVASETEYTLSVNETFSHVGYGKVCCYDSSKAYLGMAINSIYPSKATSWTFKTLANTAYVRVSVIAVLAHRWKLAEVVDLAKTSGAIFRTIRTKLSDGTALWTTPTVVASFTFAQKAYKTAEGSATKWTSLEDTIEQYNKTYGTEYKTLDGVMLNMYSSIKQNSDGIELKADSDTVIVSNMLKGSEDWAHGAIWGGTVTEDKYNGCTVLTGTFPSSSYNDLCQWDAEYREGAIEAGTAYTLSFWAKASADCTVISYLYPSACKSERGDDGNTETRITTEWERYEVHWETLDDLSGDKYVLPVRLLSANADAAGTTVYVAGVKLEKGSKATEWSAARSELATSAQLSVKQGEILSTVKETYATKDGSGTKESDIKQLSDSVTTSFKEVYRTCAAPNLAAGSSNGNGWVCTAFADATSEGNGHLFARSTTATTESFIAQYNVRLEAGKTYTLSGYVRTNGYVKDVELFAYDGTVSNIYSQKFAAPTLWTLMSLTFTPKTDSAYTWDKATIRFDNNGSTVEGTEAILYVKDIKLEEGSNATPWCMPDADVPSTLIHENSDGISVGKGTQAADGTVTWTSGQFHTLQGNGTFQVLDASGKAYTTIGAGTATIGNANAPHTTIESAGMTVYGGSDGKTQYLSATNSGFVAGNPSGYHTTADSSGFQMLNGSTVWSSLQANSVSLASGGFTVSAPSSSTSGGGVTTLSQGGMWGELKLTADRMITLDTHAVTLGGATLYINDANQLTTSDKALLMETVVSTGKGISGSGANTSSVRFENTTCAGSYITSMYNSTIPAVRVSAYVEFSNVSSGRNCAVTIVGANSMGGATGYKVAQGFTTSAGGICTVSLPQVISKYPIHWLIARVGSGTATASNAALTVSF